ncbi:hypothetical protein TTHERM_000780769 (macronuclear) [Tetrahymena thermophila SB210]|uniref:Uncharacterized protein n=1 Tax=Tetrahymena thermophila (strain SB210) TaxID=312017 RepID=W7XF39_TETTS|nr:hypothetical protein TTHERM_000780769 [Tetrahymena thermophila SB210]EWS71379.1 hypothetical protein TTHERM_000780769 [Tetrahymena thermophila SB210]|eukprot:XP_012656080.1 hypothetical protein TTHERM_000780769 [Tetrahymena thermophila SB210]
MGSAESYVKNDVQIPDWSRYCPTCGSTGYIQSRELCSNCNGQGYVFEKNYQSHGGVCSNYENTKCCSYCHGKGESREREPCKDC